MTARRQWTPIEKKRLVDLFNAGFTREKIAEVMGKTHGQVSGMCFRLKLTPPAELARKRRDEALAKGWRAAAAKRAASRRPSHKISNQVAAEMIQQAVAAGKVTKCPTRYCAPIQGL